MSSFENDDPLIKRRRILRGKYADFLVWFSTLKRNHIHQKVMATAKKLSEDTTLNFNREEALRLAVHQRKYLLNSIIVEEPMEVGFWM